MIVFAIACFCVATLCVLIGIGMLGARNTMVNDILAIGGEDIKIHTSIICLRATQFYNDDRGSPENFSALNKSMIIVIYYRANQELIKYWPHG